MTASRFGAGHGFAMRRLAGSSVTDMRQRSSGTSAPSLRHTRPCRSLFSFTLLPCIPLGSGCKLEANKNLLQGARFVPVVQTPPPAPPPPEKPLEDVIREQIQEIADMERAHTNSQIQSLFDCMLQRSNTDFCCLEKRVENGVQQMGEKCESLEILVKQNLQEEVHNFSRLYDDHTQSTKTILQDMECRSASTQEQHLSELRQLHTKTDMVLTDKVEGLERAHADTAQALKAQQAQNMNELRHRLESMIGHIENNAYWYIMDAVNHMINERGFRLESAAPALAIEDGPPADLDAEPPKILDAMDEKESCRDEQESEEEAKKDDEDEGQERADEKKDARGAEEKREDDKVDERKAQAKEANAKEDAAAKKEESCSPPRLRSRKRSKKSKSRNHSRRGRSASSRTSSSRKKRSNSRRGEKTRSRSPRARRRSPRARSRSSRATPRARSPSPRRRGSDRKYHERGREARGRPPASSHTSRRSGQPHSDRRRRR